MVKTRRNLYTVIITSEGTHVQIQVFVMIIYLKRYTRQNTAKDDISE